MGRTRKIERGERLPRGAKVVSRRYGEGRFLMWSGDGAKLALGYGKHRYYRCVHFETVEVFINDNDEVILA